MNIGERITCELAGLPPQQQRAASFLLDHLAEVATYDSAELAEMSRVSTATMSRLVRSLGYRDWRELREHVRELRHAGAPRSSPPEVDVIARHASAEVANLRAFFSSVPAEKVTQTAKHITGARRVLVVGFRNAYPVALHLREQLSQLRTDVGIAPLPGQSLGEELATYGPDDLVLLVGLRRRPDLFNRLFRGLVVAGVPIVLIADASARRYAAETVEFFEVPLDSVGSLSSYTAVMSLAVLLENAVAATDPVATHAHTQAINGWFEVLSETEVAW